MSKTTRRSNTSRTGTSRQKIFVGGPQGGPVTLSPADFVARGGQAAVYAKAGIAYKLYTDPQDMIPAGKLQELAAITDPRIIKPERLVSHTKTGKAVGYCMQFVPDAAPLCRLFPRSYRERHGVTVATTLELARALQELVVAVHDAGVLVVDLNEMNFLVDPSHTTPYGIDADSYQTPHYPASVIMPSVRDWHTPTGQLSELSDWFSFAVVSFQLFIGIHPYKGKHPSVKGLEPRMKQNLSVLDPDVSLPKVCYPLDVIPEVYRRWYDAILQQGRRLPPPTDLHAQAMLAPPPRALQPSRGIDIHELGSFEAAVVGVYHSAGALLVHTNSGLWLDDRRLADAPGGPAAVGFTPGSNRPIVASLSDHLMLFDPVAHTKLDIELAADELTSVEGCLTVRSGSQIVQLELLDVGSTVIASPRVIAQVHPQATRLYDGVAIQSLLGACYASLFTGHGASHQVRVAELDAVRVVDARYDGRVLMVIAATDQRYARFVLRFDPTFEHYDLRRIDDVATTNLNFVTLDTGVCVCLDEHDHLELFANRPGSAAVRIIEDDALGGDLILARTDGQVLFSRADTLYRMSLSRPRTAAR